MPAAQVNVDALACVFSVVAVRGWQRRQQFDQRRVRHLAQSEVGQQPRRLNQKERLRFVFAQARQVGAVLFHERPAAMAAALGDHRHACHAERFHVAVNRPLADFQTRRQLARRYAPVNLKQQHDRKQPIRAHRSSPLHIILKRRPLYHRNMTKDVRFAGACSFCTDRQESL